MTSRILSLPTAATLNEFVDVIRVDAGRRLEPDRRSAFGQFFTPAPVAALMASLSQPTKNVLRVLDPGAGVGALTAALIARVCERANPPSEIHVTAFELDARLLDDLRRVLDQSRDFAATRGVKVSYNVRDEDFIRAAVGHLNGGLFGAAWPEFDVAILNPPYRKFRTDSVERSLMREVGLETTNLYTAFVALALRSLVDGGELIAITPRSFCNGPYFTGFRRDMLDRGSLTNVHVFDSRSSAFSADDVLQENVVFRVVRGVGQADTVSVEWSESGREQDTERRLLPFDQVVRPGDRDRFIHITPDEWDSRVADIVRALRGTLDTIGVQVSTGRVVDFRAKEHLRSDAEEGSTVPLIYPGHIQHGRVVWPRKDFRKPNALARNEDTGSLLTPTGTFVLVKRFSSKEERRRVVAAVFTPDAAPAEFVAFENHLNYYHRRGRGLPRKLAEGLAAFLNSTLLDTYFRQFNGHTQVNATDLRKLPYPTVEQLERIGDAAGVTDQTALDDLVEEELLQLPTVKRGRKGDVEKRIGEASAVLKAIGLPREQTNPRAALTLLALLDLKPLQAWSEATAPLCGVTPIMEFAAQHYGKHWKPNTRETVRRFTLHQFRDAGLVVPNPDKPDRPTNSPGYVYQVPDVVLEVLRLYGTSRWDDALKRYLAAAPTLAARYASERHMQRIPLRILEGQEISLSPGGQNELIRQIIDEFCPRFTPGAVPVYIGDADKKWGYYDEAALLDLGVTVDAHGKMPDVVVHFTDKNWLVLIEAVTSHGPIDPKRRGELIELFGSSDAPLVFVTAFLSRHDYTKYAGEIAWETEVWFAEAPSHMVHFNGERFLGPYE